MMTTIIFMFVVTSNLYLAKPRSFIKKIHNISNRGAGVLNISLLFSLDFKSAWPCDTIWWQSFRSQLAQVMTCCLTASSHDLNLCWLVIGKALWHFSGANFLSNISAIHQRNYLDNCLSNRPFKSPRVFWVKIACSLLVSGNVWFRNSPE